MSNKQICAFVILCIASFQHDGAAAATYMVNPAGTGDFPTIQAAINASSDMDVIVLAAGIYTGDGNRDISFLGKQIEVRSQDDAPEICIIDCEGSESHPHRGFLFDDGEGPGSLLRGITISNGLILVGGDVDGGGLCIKEASPTIEKCIISGNRVISDSHYCLGGGVAIRGESSHPVFDGCTISSNYCNIGGTQMGLGGGVYSQNASPQFVDCEISDNQSRDSGGGFYANSGAPVLDGCLFARNESSSGAGANLFCDFQATHCTCGANVAANSGGGAVVGHGTLSNCTFVGNSAANHGGGISSQAIGAVLEYCIVAMSTSGEGVYELNDGPPRSGISLSCCDVYGNVGGNYGGTLLDQTGMNGNISEDPLFCDMYVDDFTLNASSPCLPEGNDCHILIGAHEMGCGEATAPSTWSEIKASY